MEIACIHHACLHVPVVHQVRALFAFNLPELHCCKVDTGKRRPVHHDDRSFGKPAVQKEVETDNTGRSLLWPPGNRDVNDLAFCIHCWDAPANIIGRIFKRFVGFTPFCRRIFPQFFDQDPVFTEFFPQGPAQEFPAVHPGKGIHDDEPARDLVAGKVDAAEHFEI